MKYTKKINANKDFVILYKKGKYVPGKNCVVYFRRNNRNFNRLGISTSKKIGNAVERSRARRVIRAAYRENENIFPIGYDVVITARQDCARCKSYHISSFLKNKVIPFMVKNSEKNIHAVN